MKAALLAATCIGCLGSRTEHLGANVKDAATDSAEAAAPDTVDSKKGAGQECTLAAQCASGYCVDGYCCDTPCDALCLTCGLATSLGTCSPVRPGDQPRGTGDCEVLDRSTCSLDGTCDGAGKCRNHPSGTVCLPGVCEGDAVIGTNTCDGAGLCRPAAPAQCGPYSCNRATNSCFPACNANSDCSGGRPCLNGRCGRTEPAACALSEECASQNCVEGVCCNTACTDPCRSCNLPGSIGSCTLVPAGLRHHLCAAQDPSTCGTTGLCNGAGACVKYDDGTACGDARVCQAGSCGPAMDSPTD